MSNLSIAIKKSFDDWVTKIDKDFAEAERLGLIPEISFEQFKAEAREIWKIEYEENRAS